MDIDYAKRIKAYQTTEISFKFRLAKWEAKIVEATQRLEIINRAIKERTDYQTEQEILIAIQAEAGNLLLRGLEYEIIEANHVIKNLKESTRVLWQDKRLLQQDLASVRKEFAAELPADDLFML